MYARVGRRSLLVLAAAGLVLGACDKQDAADDQTTGSVRQEDARAARAGWPAGAAAQLDSGNAAFSNKDHQEALRHYQVILDMPDAPKNLQTTAYFGLYMTYSALGDTVAAQAASDKLRELSPDASLLGHENPMLMDSSRPAPQPPNDSIHRGGGQ